MDPFTRIVWFDAETKNKWEPLIQRASRAYNATELATFELGMRKAIVYHVIPENLMSDLEFFAKSGYVFLPITKSRMYEGFSHRHIPPKHGEPYFIYGVLAKNLDDAKMFKDCSQGKVDHETIGRLLGYPKCCIDFFTNVWGNGVIDPIFEAYGAEAHIHPFCNQALRYFGLRITPHLCCSANCQKTIKMGKKWISIMRKLDAEGANAAFQLLSMPFEWSCLNGAAIVDTALFRGVTNSNMVKEKITVKNWGWKV